jgi:hypothetical protein
MGWATFWVFFFANASDLSVSYLSFYFGPYIIRFEENTSTAKKDPSKSEFFISNCLLIWICKKTVFRKLKEDFDVLGSLPKRWRHGDKEWMYVPANPPRLASVANCRWKSNLASGRSVDRCICIGNLYLPKLQRLVLKRMSWSYVRA